MSVHVCQVPHIVRVSLVVHAHQDDPDRCRCGHVGPWTDHIIDHLQQQGIDLNVKVNP